MNVKQDLLRLIGGAQKRLASDVELSTVLRGGFIVLMIQIIGAALSFFSIALVARMLGAEQYGVFAFYFSLLTVLALFGGIGFPAATVKFVAEYRERRNYGALKGFLRFAFWLTIFSGAAIALIAGGATNLFGLAFGSAPPQLYWAAFAAVPLLAAATLYAETARAYLWPLLYEAPSRIIRPLILIGGVALIQLSGQTPTALTAILSALAGILAVLCVLQIATGAKLRPDLRSAPPLFEPRKWFAMAIPMLASRGFGFVLLEIDILMTGIFLAPADVAIYQAAARTSMLAAMIIYAQNAFIAPRVAALFESGRRDEVQKLLRSVVRLTFVLSLAFAAALIAFGKPILSLFGHEFTAGHSVLIVLVLSVLTTISTGPLGIILNMTGHQKLCAYIMGGAVLLNLAMHALLIPMFGIVGAALAVLIANVVTRSVMLSAVNRTTGLNPTVS